MAQRIKFIRAMALTALVLVAIMLGACAPREQNDSRQRAAQVSLGKKLFSDASLSVDRSVSCSSCHDSRHAFSDGRVVALGVHHTAGTRNAPSLLNVAAMQSFFWDGREATLERVVLQPFTNSVEMGLPDRNALIHRIARDPGYKASFAQAFPDDSTVNERNITTALAAYVRSLPHGTSRYDAFKESKQHRGLDDDERHGLALFDGKAGCAQCHRLMGEPAALTDNRFHHTGIGFERIAGNIGPLIAKLDAMDRQGKVIGGAVLTDPEIAELGHFAATRRPADLGAFRTPSLRNVARTAPYMHDGSVPTLQAAVERELYYRGLESGRPIELTVPEQRQLLAFLKALDDR